MATRNSQRFARVVSGLQAQQQWWLHSRPAVRFRQQQWPARTAACWRHPSTYTWQQSRAFTEFSIDWGIPLQADGPPTPVTLLSGFLGAGKTTLLKHLLENRSGLRVGVIVNDVAAVNVDANLIVSQFSDSNDVEVAELQNGCVCCSLADDLLTSVAEVMIRGRGLHHLVIELSGVGEPEAIKTNWALARELRHPAALRAQLSRVVTVVDSSCFRADWLDGRSARERNQDADHSGDSQKSIVELLATQIETADVVLLNKVDLVTTPEVSTTEAVISAVNPNAELLCASYGEVDTHQLLPSPGTASSLTSDEASSIRGSIQGDAHGHSHGHDSDHGHGHGHTHSHGHNHETSPAERYGIHSFVYNARRPFHASRFGSFMSELRDIQPLELLSSSTKGTYESAMTGLLRAKGVCWIDSEPFLEHAWSFAGRTVTLSKGDLWWAACNQKHLLWRMAYPGVQAVYDRVRNNSWDETGDWGDRRQEIVFIGGPTMDEASLRQRLDKCLLTEPEMTSFCEEFLGKTVPFEMDFGR